MDRQNFAIYGDRLRKNFEFEISRGYTLIELMVVIAIIAVIAVISLFGLNNFRDAEAVKSASKQVLSDLRGMQNRVVNGGVPPSGTTGSNNANIVVFNAGVSSLFYTINGSSIVNLPVPVTIKTEYPNAATNPSVTLCLLNPNVNTTSGYNCTCFNNNFACTSSASSGKIDSSFNLVFMDRAGNKLRKITISGSGTQVTNMYEGKY